MNNKITDYVILNDRNDIVVHRDNKTYKIYKLTEKRKSKMFDLMRVNRVIWQDTSVIIYPAPIEFKFSEF